MKHRQPEPLKPGDKVAIISPSAGLPSVFPWVYRQGLQRIREIFHLEPVEFPTACASPGYLSANPQARAKDVNDAFADPTIKGIIATIGGNDQVRILSYLDKDLISKNHKRFFGYSDCTNLHLFLWNLGMTSYYGGAVMTQFAMGGEMDPYTIESLQKGLFSPTIGHVTACNVWSDIDLDWANRENLSKKRGRYPSTGWLWHNNKGALIQGKLWGGCLEVLTFHLSIKRYLPSVEELDGTILYIETSEEMPHEVFVYRFLAALAELDILNRFKAILVGYPKAQFMGQEPPEGRAAYLANQQQAIKQALIDYEVSMPVIFNMNFGHTDPQMLIPNGAIATIDGKNKTISFEN